MFHMRQIENSAKTPPFISQWSVDFFQKIFCYSMIGDCRIFSVECLNTHSNTLHSQNGQPECHHCIQESWTSWSYETPRSSPLLAQGQSGTWYAEPWFHSYWGDDSRLPHQVCACTQSSLLQRTDGCVGLVSFSHFLSLSTYLDMQDHGGMLNI